MSEPGEYIVDLWYFANHSEVRTKRFRASSLEDAEKRRDQLITLRSTSRVRISKKGFGRTLDVISVWQARCHRNGEGRPVPSALISCGQPLPKGLPPPGGNRFRASPYQVIKWLRKTT